MRQQKASIYKLVRCKALKTQQICHYGHTREKTATSFIVRRERRL